MKTGFFTREDLKKPPVQKTRKVTKLDLPASHFHALGLDGVTNLNTNAKTPNMQPSGVKSPLVYILGEAPGQSEDEEGRFAFFFFFPSSCFYSCSAF